MHLALSGVIERVEISRSALPVCSSEIRVGPVVVTISSSTPRSLASSRATSTSDPVGWSLSSVMPNGGIARSMAIRIFFACGMSSSVSACAGSPNDSRASSPSKAMRSVPAVLIARSLLDDDIGQIVAVMFLVDRVQRAVLDVCRDPFVDLVEQALLVLLDADRELERIEHELDFDLARRILLGDRRHQQFDLHEAVDLAAPES